MPAPCSWVTRAVEVLSPKLPAVQTIRLINLYDIGKYVDNPFFLSLSVFTITWRLVLHGCALDGSIFLGLLSASNLTHVQFLHFRDLSLSPDIAPRQLYVPRLKSLGLDTGRVCPYFFGAMLQWTSIAVQRIFPPS